jgi:hypothetical protein
LRTKEGNVMALIQILLALIDPYELDAGSAMDPNGNG